MSNQQNEAILEDLFDEGMDMGLTTEQAAKYARERFEDLPEPDYKRNGGMSKAVMKKRGGTFKGIF
jgi:pyrroline-5-carboxylate reductase|tara:strand:- start:6986 stop:7183 length:198 start_codon:yes stop_codon:yes gene_type:complete